MSSAILAHGLATAVAVLVSKFIGRRHLLDGLHFIIR